MSLPRPMYEAKPLPQHFAAGDLGLLVFGPGHGEAMVVILPDGSLGVLDGCREPTNGDPVREFVAACLAAEPTRRISFIGLTHPHEDHYRGLGRLIEEHDGIIERLWRTQLTSEQWGTAYIQYAEICEQNGDRVPVADELAGLQRVIGAFEGRDERLDVLGENREMLRRRIDGRWLSVHSLAPSFNDVDRAQRQLLGHIRTQQRVRHDPNLTSAALLLTWGKAKMLLGGDLVCAHGGFQGWDTAARWVRGPVQVVKASHHASRLAQHWELWERMAPALTIVTPFRQAVLSQPPRPAEIRRLLALPQNVAITSVPQWVGNGGVDPRPIDPPRSRARAMGRNPALAITPVPLPTDDAVGVSIDAEGTITRLILTGNARLYQ